LDLDQEPQWASWDDVQDEPRPKSALERLPGFRRIQNPRLRVASAVMCAVLLICSLGSIPVALLQYSQLSGLGASGIKHFRTAASMFTRLSQNPFDAQSISTARQELQAGIVDFNQIDRDISQIPAVVTAAPVVGSRLIGVKRLTPIAVEGATAGMIACDALTLLSARLRNPLDTTSAGGVTQADLDTLGGYLDHIGSLFQDVTTRLNALSPGDLSVDARLGPAVTQFRDNMPKIQQLLQDAKTFLGAAPLVLGVGAPTTYLIEVMDSTELRPSGGFIGNYGVASVSGGRLGEVHITDVDLLDRPFEARGGVIAKPAQYAFFNLVQNWSFRDSNLDADFPTSAVNGIQTYQREGGAVDMQGVIALTPWLVRDAMRLTGPITVDEYKETVTADTLVNTIHHHQLGANHGNDTIPDAESGSSQRKRFTALLFEDFFKQLKAVAAKDPSTLVKLFMNGVRSKDIQIYLKPEAAQKVLVSNHLGSAIEAPEKGDSLFVVDANITPNKANYFMTNVMKDDVTIDANGVATHVLTLSYNWPVSQAATANNYGIRTFYRDYLRIFTPPSSVLQAQSGLYGTGAAKRFDRSSWGGYLKFNYGASAVVTYTWAVPGAATKNGATWTYHYLVQRQAGITWKLDSHVALPTCAKIVGKPEGLTVQSPTAVSTTGNLVSDKTYEIVYTC
jgi:hypothetical protein